MAQVLVNFRMDKEDKIGMEEVCKELGMSMTTAFTIFAKKMKRLQEIDWSRASSQWHLRTIQANGRMLRTIH